MARKRRQAIETQAEEQKKPAYKDPFQQKVGKQVEQLGKGLEGRGKQILYVLLALAVIVILAFVVYSYSRRQNNAAQAALGKAIETSQAQVSASPMPGYQGRIFTTEKEKSEAAIADFQEVANKFGSPYSDRAKYFMAVERLKLDREAGLNELQEVTKSSDKDTAALAKFALAQAKAADGKLDEAVALYNELLSQNGTLPAKETLNFELAGLYEKQSKTAEAADIYFNIVKNAREAKTADGKPLPMTGTAREATTKLEKIAPDKARELPPEPSAADEG
jgi:tetratricopeptide (TPR) repeat protein